MALNSLPLFHRIAGQRVVVLGDGDMGEAKRRLVERAGGIPCGEPEAHHAKLAFIALDDERAAASAHLRLKRLGLLVNVADRPELCDFTTPSILDRDPVLVAVSTGGASAGLAKQLRLRLERWIPQNIGALASALFDRRDAIRARFPDGAERRRALDAALGDGGALDVARGGSAAQVDLWLAGDAGERVTGVVEFALTGDDPEELTLRQARLLGEADIVWHDPRVAEAILTRARADAVRRELGSGDIEGNEGELAVVLRLQTG